MLVETEFLLALVTTVAVEAPAVLLILKYLIGFKGASPAKILSTAALASCLTLPYLWFVLPPYVDARLYILIGEAFVVLVEAIVYNRLLGLDIIKSVLLSAAANMLSFLAGLIVL